MGTGPSRLSRRHHPAQLLGGFATGLQAPQVNQQLAPKGDNGAFARPGFHQ